MQFHWPMQQKEKNKASCLQETTQMMIELAWLFHCTGQKQIQLCGLGVLSRPRQKWDEVISCFISTVFCGLIAPLWMTSQMNDRRCSVPLYNDCPAKCLLGIRFQSLGLHYVRNLVPAFWSRLRQKWPLRYCTSFKLVTLQINSDF